MGSKYIEAKTFDEFKCNQDKLISVLNHNMTKMSTDVGWLKKFTATQTGILVAIFLAMLGIMLKLVVG
jgi:hypothetical protein